MNISGVVIRVLPEHEDELVAIAQASDLCEYHLNENGKIVVTIEGDDVVDDMRIMNEIRKFPHVLSAEMAYSYCEEELDEERDKLLNNEELPSWLNNEEARVEDISYHGDLKKNVK